MKWLVVTKCWLPEVVPGRILKGHLGFVGKSVIVDFWNKVNQYYVACVLLIFIVTIFNLLTVTDDESLTLVLISWVLPFHSCCHHSYPGICSFSSDYEHILCDFRILFLGLSFTCCIVNVLHEGWIVWFSFCRNFQCFPSVRCSVMWCSGSFPIRPRQPPPGSSQTWTGGQLEYVANLQVSPVDSHFLPLLSLSWTGINCFFFEFPHHNFCASILFCL